MNVVVKNKLMMLSPNFAGSVEQMLSEPPRSLLSPAQKARKQPRLAFYELVDVMGPWTNLPLRYQLLNDMHDPAIDAGVLFIDSPGGTAESTPELASIAARYRAAKPIYAVVQGMCCSAAYYVAANCTSITASESSLIGSIGTMFVLIDESEFYGKLGVKVLVIASGTLKGAGVPGTKFDTPVIEMMRRLVDSVTSRFQASVMRGRKMNARKIYDVSSGDVWYAPEAKNLGLIDNIMLPEERVAQIMYSYQPVRVAPPAPTGAVAYQQFNELAIAAAKSEYPEDNFYDAEDVPADILKRIRKENSGLAAEAAKHEENLPNVSPNRFDRRKIRAT